MKTLIKSICMLLLFLPLMAGCTTNNDKDPMPSMSPSPMMMSDTTVNDYLNYMMQNKLAFTDISPIENMDFNALEGSTFNMGDQMYYLYRFDLNNENSKKMLDYAKESGKMKVVINGTEKEMYSLINENYALIYGDNAPIDEIKNIFGTYDFQSYANSVPEGSMPSPMPSPTPGM